MRKYLCYLNPVITLQKIHAELTALVLYFFANSAFASGQGLGAIGKQAGENASGLATGLTSLLALIGLGLIGFGLMKLRNARQQGESPGSAIGMMVIGACLMSIKVIASVLSTTVFGADQTEESMNLIK